MKATLQKGNSLETIQVKLIRGGVGLYEGNVLKRLNFCPTPRQQPIDLNECEILINGLILEKGEAYKVTGRLAIKFLSEVFVDEVHTITLQVVSVKTKTETEEDEPTETYIRIQAAFPGYEKMRVSLYNTTNPKDESCFNKIIFRDRVKGTKGLMRYLLYYNGTAVSNYKIDQTDDHQVMSFRNHWSIEQLENMILLRADKSGDEFSKNAHKTIYYSTKEMKSWNDEPIGKTSTKQRKFERCILEEANHIVNSDRPARYGGVDESFNKIANLANAMFDDNEMMGHMTAQKIVKVFIATKLVRDQYSPDNADHLRDAVGYTELLDQLRQLDIP